MPQSQGSLDSVVSFYEGLGGLWLVKCCHPYLGRKEVELLVIEMSDAAAQLSIPPLPLSLLDVGAGS